MVNKNHLELVFNPIWLILILIGLIGIGFKPNALITIGLIAFALIGIGLIGLKRIG
jgi:hypothetical protein